MKSLAICIIGGVKINKKGINDVGQACFIWNITVGALLHLQLQC